jgi:parallel beta-helix repeat protein
MHKKTIRIIIALATIFLISSLFIHAEPAKTSIWDSLFPPSNNPFITINSDGSITPSDMPIKRVGDVYYLTGSIRYYHMVIRRENAVLDGQGFTFLGNKSDAGIGINPQANNITIRNLIIESFPVGIEPIRSSGGAIPEGQGTKITNNTVSDCNSAIEIVYETNTSVSDNVVKNNNMYGIHLRDSYGNIIYRNFITNNSIGIYFAFSHDNAISLNTVLENKKGVSIVNPYWYQREEDANVFTKNDFLRNDYGAYFAHSNNSRFFLNNFINNSNNVNGLQNNFWDNGSAGNYWSDYGGSGVYTVDVNNIDHYPLKQQVDILELPLSSSEKPTSTASDNFITLESSFMISVIVFALLTVTVVILLLYRRHRDATKQEENQEA